MNSVTGAFLMLAMSQSAGDPTNQRPEYFPAPTPAPYSNAVRFGNVLFLSGQTGEGPDGKLPSTFEAQARGTMENIGAILKERGLGWDDVVKCTVMLENIADWPKFNKIYVPYFRPGRLPARSAIGADGLAGGALIELECWAGVPPKSM